jgi:hypothetical protein
MGQFLFRLRERYESHAPYQICYRELGLTLTLESKDTL